VAPIPIRGLLVSMASARQRATRVTGMNKRFYLSTQKDRDVEMTPFLEALKSKGWKRTFDWTRLAS
jgi:hypothetical protein